MAISTISQVISDIPVDKEIIVGSRNLPENIQWFASADGMPLRSTQINTIASQFNTSIGQVNLAIGEIEQIYADTKVQQGIMSGYLTSTKQYTEEAQGYANAANLSYQNTVVLLDEVDIAGTGGYTIEAIDDQEIERELIEFLDFNS